MFLERTKSYLAIETKMKKVRSQTMNEERNEKAPPWTLVVPYLHSYILV